MTYTKGLNHNDNPLVSAFWIPLLLLPIISFSTNPNNISPKKSPQTFYQNQLDYFDHRNAVITFWDTFASQTDIANNSLQYLSDHKSNKLININFLQNYELYNNNVLGLKLSLGRKQSDWRLSIHPQAIQLPRIIKLGINNSQIEHKAFQVQLNWTKRLDWSNIPQNNLLKISKLILQINKLQHNKNLKDLIYWGQLQKRLYEITSKIKQSNLSNILDRYSSYQKSFFLLELASHINQSNVVEIINIILNFDLLDSLIIDDTDLFSLPLASRTFELNVLIDPTRLEQYRHQIIRRLSSSARKILESYSQDGIPWQYTTALARSYQLELLNPSIKANQRTKLELRVQQLISPNSKNSLAYNRSLSHPDGADFRIKDTYYKLKISKFSEQNKISLSPIIVDYQSPFSDSIQTIKLNDDHYIIDTYNRDCYQLDNSKFIKVSRLPHNVSPLSQAVVQPDPQLGQPRVFIFGGFPSSNTAYTSNNMVQFNLISKLIPMEGRYYFGMSQYRSNSSGLEKTLVIGGTKGRSDDLARFQDIHSSVDGLNWTKINTMDWTSRHSFGLTQLKNSIIAFGGCRYFEKGRCFNEVWSSNDGIEFEKLIDAPWAARGGMAYTINPMGLFMFGGANETRVFSDLWMTSDGKNWIQIPISTIGSVNSQLIITDNHLWILGGKTIHGRYAPSRSFKITRKAVQSL